MNYTAKISLTIAILAIIAGSVWYARRPAQETPPTDGGTDVVVDNTTDGVSDGKIDTNDWVEYRNDELGFSIKHPVDYRFNEIDNEVKSIRGCFITTDENGVIVCRGGGGRVDFEIYPDFDGSTSWEGLEFMKLKYKDFYAEYGITKEVNPKSTNQILIDGNIYYQAEYFGGDSTEVDTYLPREKGLLIYNYNVYPIGNDPNPVYHEQLAKTMLSTLKLD